MSEEKTHDLYDFMQQLSQEMAAEYDRIQKHAVEDPGTAGDQGEENWAELLRGWLPRTYEVVTKGRIISADGRTSPQVDVLVLKNVYPEKLLDKKLYLAAGVVAAFECKITLKTGHIEQAMKTCATIKKLYPDREGTPYRELHTPIAYGLLAHSHSWIGRNSASEMHIRKKLLEYDKLHVTHPRECLDVVCVADLAAWTSFIMVRVLPGMIESPPSSIQLDKSAFSSYFKHSPFRENQLGHFTPIGALISNLSQRIAWEDSALRDLADYYRSTQITGVGEGLYRLWPTSIYSDVIRSRVEAVAMRREAWDEWNWVFPYLEGTP